MLAPERMNSAACAALERSRGTLEVDLGARADTMDHVAGAVDRGGRVPGVEHPGQGVIEQESHVIVEIPVDTRNRTVLCAASDVGAAVVQIDVVQTRPDLPRAGA